MAREMRARATEGSKAKDGGVRRGRFSGIDRIGRGKRLAFEGPRQIHADLGQLLEDPQAPFGAQDGGIGSFGEGGGVGHMRSMEYCILQVNGAGCRRARAHGGSGSQTPTLAPRPPGDGLARLRR